MASACAGMVSAASLSARQVNGVRARQPVRASPRPRSASFRARVATRRARRELFPRDVDVGRRRASARVGGATRARTRPARRERIHGRADASVAPPTIRGGVSASTRARASGPLFRTSPRRDRAANSPFYPLPPSASGSRAGPRGVRGQGGRGACLPDPGRFLARARTRADARTRPRRFRPGRDRAARAPPRRRFARATTPRAATHRTARERPIFTQSKRSPRAPKQRRADDENVFSPRRPPSPPEPFRLPSRRRRFASG